jgi:hypothetical protein
MTPRSLVGGNVPGETSASVFINPEAGSSELTRNVGNRVPNYIIR